MSDTILLFRFDPRPTLNLGGDRLRERIRNIVDRPPARARFAPLTGEVRGPEGWRLHVGEACADLRLCTVAPRPNWGLERELIRSWIAEMLKPQIEFRLAEVFNGLASEEQRMANLTNIQRGIPCSSKSSPKAASESDRSPTSRRRSMSQKILALVRWRSTMSLAG